MDRTLRGAATNRASPPSPRPFARPSSSGIAPARSSTCGHGESSATPTVEVDFELDGKPCRLTKAFLGKKRCELVIGGKSMDGAVAEDHLAALLGFRFPGKGASTPEHMGIPGCCGSNRAPRTTLPAPWALSSDHLRNALGESLGELASSNGDAVLKAVGERAQRTAHACRRNTAWRLRGCHQAAHGARSRHRTAACRHRVLSVGRGPPLRPAPRSPTRRSRAALDGVTGAACYRTATAGRSQGVERQEDRAGRRAQAGHRAGEFLAHPTPGDGARGSHGRPAREESAGGTRRLGQGAR